LFGTWTASESYLRFSQRFLSLSTASVFEKRHSLSLEKNLQSASFSYCIDLKGVFALRVYFEESEFLRLPGCEPLWPPCSGLTKLLSAIWKSRLLSIPRVVCMDGETALFLFEHADRPTNCQQHITDNRQIKSSNPRPRRPCWCIPAAAAAAPSTAALAHVRGAP
jgi:hypothetical protein